MINPELLTAEQEVALGRRVRAWLDDGGDEADGIAARNELVERNLPLVVSVRKRYFRIPVSRCEDADQEGNRGLLRAAELFDPERGTRFATYATRWIRQFIQRQGQRDRLIYVPPYCILEKNRPGAAARSVYALANQALSVASLAELAESGFEVAGPPDIGEDEDSHVEKLRDLLNSLYRAAGVDDVQADCISAFYGVGRDRETLEETARRLGYTYHKAASNHRARAFVAIRNAARYHRSLRLNVEDMIGKVAI